MLDFPLTDDPRIKKVRTQHVEGIDKKKAEVANQIGANSCPKCGGELITRIALNHRASGLVLFI